MLIRELALGGTSRDASPFEVLPDGGAVDAEVAGELGGAGSVLVGMDESGDLLFLESMLVLSV